MVKLDRLEIVIPVYNEGAGIERTLDEITAVVRTPHRISIVYDFEADDTVPVVRRRMEAQPNLRLVMNRHGRGALAAIRSGFDAAEYGAVLVVMADASDRLDVVDRMFAMMNDGYDVVCGSRYMRGGRQIGGPRFKKLLSRGAGLSLRYVFRFPTHDVTNSFKMYAVRVLRSITIESTGGFEIGMEITVKAHQAGYRVGEVPTTWTDRTTGQSRFRLWKWLPRYLRWYRMAIFGGLTRRRTIPEPNSPATPLAPPIAPPHIATALGPIRNESASDRPTRSTAKA
jgi:dolichol-phosphate mannosyltransferase